jgi:PPP family 3-phenylpropionic acid transporter
MSKPSQPTPYYWRLSSFYLFYFASLGALVPFWPVYLKSLSFSPREIGEILGIIMATKIVSPNVWGWIADHTGRRMRIVQWGSLAAVICFAGVLLDSSYWWLVLVMTAFSFFWNATLPQFEATTFNHLGGYTHRYSSIRLWGSIGFIITVSLLGPLLENYGTAILPVAILCLIAGIWASSLSVPEQAAGYQHLEHEHLWNVLKRPEVLALVIVVFLMQASHGPYYTFYSIYMEDHGYGKDVIGQLWALGVVAEVGVFLLMHKMLPHFGLRNMLLFSLVTAVVRWWLIGYFPENITLVIIAQCMHAATFGVYHATAIQLFHRYFTGRHQGRGQAIYSSMSFGAGGALGSFVSGYTWESLGSTQTYTISIVIAALAVVIAWRYIPRLQ